jgi:hypothetical protein
MEFSTTKFASGRLAGTTLESREEEAVQHPNWQPYLQWVVEDGQLPGNRLPGSQLSVVAGARFELTTFRL